MELHLLNLLLVLLAAWLAGNLANRFGYPAVLGELLAGIILGPPALGLLEGGEALAVLAEVGVLLMMLYIGMEVDPRDLKKVSWAGALAAVGGFATPFVLAFLTVQWFGGSVMAALFVAIAAGITSLATKSRILVDLKLLDTRVAHVMMAGALISDTLSLIIFAGILGAAQEGSVDVAQVGFVALRIVLFFALTTVIGLKAFPWVGKRLSEAGLTGRTFNFTLVLLIAVIFGELAELAGLHSILGAFLAGLFLRENVLGRTLSKSLMDAVQDASIGFLAPIFFVTAGFDVSFRVFQADLGLFLSIMAVASLGKIIGTALFYLPTGFGWREGVVIGAGMNGRGAVEIIVAGIALEMGLIDQDIFSILVFMAIFTTAAVPLFLKWGTDWLRSRGELVRRDTERQGALIIGAGALARRLARQLQKSQPVWMLDTNADRCARTREEGLPVVCGNALQENVLSEAHAADVETLIAMTSNSEVNMLVAQLAKDVFAIPNLYIVQLGREKRGHTSALKRLGASRLFGGPVALDVWDHWVGQGEVREINVTPAERTSSSVDGVLEEMGCRNGIPLIVSRDDAIEPVQNGVRLSGNESVLVLCHEEATEPVRPREDRFDRLVAECPVLDLEERLDLEAFFEIVAEELAPSLKLDTQEIKSALIEREAEFSSMLAQGLAVPHIVVDEPGHFHLVIARARRGVEFPRERAAPRALFVIVRSREERTFHLRTLSAIAQVVQSEQFERNWEIAEGPQDLRELIRSVERRRFAEAEVAHGAD